MSSPVAAIREAAGNRGIRNLQLASATWGAAEAAYLVGLLVHAYAEGGSGAVAMVAVIRALPSVVLAPLLTTWTSRYRRVLVLRAVLLVRVLSVAGAGLAVAAGDSALLPFVYLLVAIDAVAATLLRPIRGALAPALARSPGELIAANLATSTGDSLAALVGPAIGAVLVGLASAGVTFAAAVLMLVSDAARVEVGAQGPLLRAAPCHSVTRWKEDGGPRLRGAPSTLRGSRVVSPTHAAPSRGE